MAMDDVRSRVPFIPLVKGYQTDDTIHFFGIQIETVRVSCSAHANTD
jgi:hypothetical protein